MMNTSEQTYFFLSFFSFHNSQKPKPRTRPNTRSISVKMRESGLTGAVSPAW